MKKNKLYIFIAILISVSFFITAAICNQCGLPVETKISEKEPVEEDIGETIGKETIVEEIVYKIAFGSEGSIFSCMPDGSDIERVYTAGFFIGNPCWNTDHTKIVFELYVSYANFSDEGSEPEIFIYDLTSGDVNRLTNRYGLDRQPSFSPDGKTVVFASSVGGDDVGTFNDEIFSVNIDGNNLIQLTDSPESDMEPCISPDGDTIVFTRYIDHKGELYIMDVDGSNIRRLTNNDAEDVYATFSPDGKYIAFVSDRSGDCDIWVMSADGSGDAKNLTNSPGRDLLPDYSPDGSMIVFESNRNEEDEYVFDIFVMTSEGENQTSITPNLKGTSQCDPSW